MKKKWVLAFLLALPWSLWAQSAKVDLLNRYMKAYALVHDFSGTVLIAQKGRIVYQKGFGLADRSWNIQNSEATRFPIASLTKQFTAAAILQLVEQGKLRLEDPISHFYADFPKGDSVTIHMLLNHTSGIKELSENPRFKQLDPNIPIQYLKDTLINLFKSEPFDFSPGSFWKYSNSGYILLGYIIEQVSGKSYRDYIYTNILTRAGMKNSDLLSQDSIIPLLARGYSITPQGWKNAGIMSFNAGFSAGGLFATAGDLYNWTKALNSGKIISAQSLASMNHPNHGDFGAGYGVFVDKFFNRKAIFHAGALQGFNSYLIRYPAEDLCIIILTNRDTNLDFLPKGLAAIMFGMEVTSTYKRVPYALDSSGLGRYVGEFEGPGIPFPLIIVEKDKKLYLRLWRDIELVPESETRFYIDEPDVEIRLQYELNANSEVNRVYYIEAGIKTEVKRK